MAEKKKVLITGFINFGNYNLNPTSILCDVLEKTSLGKYTVHTLIFGTHVQGKANHFGKIVREEVSKLGIDIVISLGLSSEVTGFRFEKKAVNWAENQKYCSSFENKTRLNQKKSKSQSYTTDITSTKFRKIKTALKLAGVPCENSLSNNAGNFCCNALAYRTLEARENKKVPYYFIHIPCTRDTLKEYDETKTIITYGKIITGLEAMLKVL